MKFIFRCEYNLVISLVCVLLQAYDYAEHLYLIAH